jgi:uncharacterized repeat protein (TIGR01451 family)
MSWKSASHCRGLARVGVLWLALANLAAGPGPDLKVRLSGSVKTPGAESSAWASIGNGAEVAPGSLILYRVEVVNTGNAEARTPVALGPIPPGTVYVAESATTGPGFSIEYSLDGGRTFSSSPTVEEKDKDGKPRRVPAPVETYTTIRWSRSTGLPAGESFQVTYQVKVR